MNHEYYMRLALEQARIAQSLGEVPVGAIVVCNDEVIAVGHNLREQDQNATAHAELIAISRACATRKSWRLSDCTLYVTLEPCPMCAGAIINSRIKTLCFGATDLKSGSCGSVINLFALDYNHRPHIYKGILEAECADILSQFFQSLRKNR